ncbi:hypothetical protein COY16_03920 [Candidatus Roizmanbacteria bacterium CG_4_10_14_0_2_um_filter_39_13]|uniref:LysM domain-containing protein n=1 Tax=Candidatus Roizmanbacteria bacterium CG_4_10_14_0_2_um_filter_39_13 TaxID=1974825 RepID=A0A2M7TXQ2_9BACT|nr:MAG: hypothetical protein COY16_03920 [Candidatus Roizmanbacteria bacterium CG_4_10_14_0_2_um_filter_39_13]
MNKKKRNAKHLHHPFHISFLTLFPLLILLAAALFSFSLWKARTDLKNIGKYLRYELDDLSIRETSIYYRVQFGDTLESIAEKFNISVESIEWANDDLPKSGIKPNMIISIPPVTGIVHTVKNNETVESIAEMYGADPYDIVNYSFNEFSDDKEFPITPGQILIVPGGTKNPIKIKEVLGVFWKRIWD